MKHRELNAFMRFLYIRDKKLWKLFGERIQIDSDGNLQIKEPEGGFTRQDVEALKRWLLQYRASQN